MRLSLIQKVSIMLAVLLVLLGGIGLLLLDRTAHLVGEVGAVARSHAVRAGLAELLGAIASAESAERGFVLSRDSAELVAYRAALERASRNLGALDVLLAANPQQRRRLRKLQPIVAVQLAAFDSAVRPAGRAARGPPSTARDSAHMGEIRALIAEMDSAAQAQLTQRVEEARSGGRMTLLVAGIGSVLAILVAMLGAGLIRAELADRTQRLAQVRASEARFRGAAEGSMDAFFLLDAIRDAHGRVTDFRVTEMNAGAEALLGRSRAGVIGRGIAELYPITREDGFLERCERVLRTGTMIDEEIPVRVPGMSASWLHQTIVRVGDGVAVTSRDITEKRWLDERLRQAQKMEAVGRLANGVAHDFNNVLAAIRASSDALSLTMLPGDPRREDVAEITRAVDRAAALTRQLLAFSRKQESRPAMVDLNMLVRGMEGLLRRLVPSEVRLITSLEPHLGLTMVDEGQLEQVLLNLVVNARDAMPHGGTLEIVTRNIDVEASRPHLHGTVEAGSYIVLAVRDTGVGIDEATMVHLFEPFFTTKPDGQGTGLGLATSYGIVRQSGGQIIVASEPGRGTEFTIYLPRRGDAEHDPIIGMPDAAPRRSDAGPQHSTRSDLPPAAFDTELDVA
ncbi:MAG TPA: ATP-binding protein [Gemmatimonadaceae bacterium]